MKQMTKPLDDPAANLLLAALLRENLTRRLPRLEPVNLRMGEVLRKKGRLPWADAI